LAAANPRFHAHLVRPAGILPLAQCCWRQGGHVSARWPPRARAPLPDHPATSRQGSLPRETAIPLPAPSLRPSRSTISSLLGGCLRVPTVQHPIAAARGEPQGFCTTPIAAEEPPGQEQGPSFGLHRHPSLTGRALLPFLPPARAARRAGGEPAGETQGPSAGAGVPGPVRVHIQLHSFS